VTPGAARLEGQTLFDHPLSAAVMTVLVERGYAAASVEEFISGGAIDRAEFEAQFRDKDDVVLRVFEAYIADFKSRVKAAYDSAPSWPENLRAAAYAVARWIGEYPDATGFGTVGILEAGEMARVRREGLFRWSAQLIDAGRAVAPDPDAVPQGAALMAIGSVVEALSRQVQGGDGADPPQLVAPMMYAAVRPYLGEEAARRELSIPLPPDLAAQRDPDPHR
jgi:AcrR family transcriptional regulator